MAGHGHGPDTPGDPEPGERKLDGEQRRLREGGLAEARFRRLPTLVGSEDETAQIEAEQGTEPVGAPVEGIAERRLVAVQLGGHPRVLRTLAREEEGDFGAAAQVMASA